MSSFLFVMWDGGGNVGPFIGLAEALVARGHTVRAVASESLRGRLAEADVQLLTAAAGFMPSAAEVVASVTDHPDAIVVDYMATSALNGARVIGAPTAALFHTLYADLMVDGAPFPIRLAGDLVAVNGERTQLGLPLLGGMADLLRECDLVAITAPQELDAPATVPSNTRYIGPLFPSAGPDRGWLPPSGDGPLVVASMGTSGQGQAPVLQRVIDALAGLAVRGFVSLPSYVEAGALSVPRNVTLSRYVRHAAVLPHADVVVTHGGLGTITTALAFGVPLVCVPEEREQPNNGAAVARTGAGVCLEREADAPTIRAAIERVLAQPRPAPCAGMPGAVELFERLASDGGPANHGSA